MDSISSLYSVPATAQDLKPEAGAAPGRDPQGKAAWKRNRGQKPNEPDDELEVDSFEHVDVETQDR